MKKNRRGSARRCQKNAVTMMRSSIATRTNRAQHHQAPLSPKYGDKPMLINTHAKTILFKDHAGRTKPVKVKPWQTIQDVKTTLDEEFAPKGFELLIEHEKLVSDSPGKRDRRLFCRGQVLHDQKTVNDYDLCDGDVVYFRAKPITSPGKEPLAVSTELNIVLGASSIPPEIESAIEKTRQGLAAGMSPKLAENGLGGTYFLRDKDDRTVGVFKPEDEEAYAPNNPRGLAGRMGSRGVRGGLLSGEANVREVAAYLLDHEKFANVPATVRVEFSHPSFGVAPKIGSFQEFKPHDDEAGDVSASLFTVEGAHRIAIMDMRLLNTDRNEENLLVKRCQKIFDLIPIDHGCSLPDSFEVNWHDWTWLSWKQMKVPLSAQDKEYIARMDADKDADLLSEELNIRWRCLLVLRVATRFLQKGAAADLTLYEIASLMSRDQPDKPSALEIVFAQAKTLAEKKRFGGTGKRRRSPPVSPNIATPLKLGGTTLRRSASALSLDEEAFRLPPRRDGDRVVWDDFWGLDDLGSPSEKELYDEVFFKYLDALITILISRNSTLKLKALALSKLRV